MIWLTWRQFRGQALVALGALAALTIHLVILGRQIRATYDAAVNCGTGCSTSAAQQTMENEYFDTLLLSGFLVVLVPALLGAFWGAPLIARELEAGTHRLVWNQSVTRSRWLTIKLAFVTVAGLAFAGALSALFTWAASPYDKLLGERFDPVFFPTRNIAPLGYAVFAVLLGITAGLVVRRTVPAMAITLAVFVGLQILMPTVIRPHLQPAVTERVPFTAAGSHGLSLTKSGVSLEGFTIPGAWVMGTRIEVLTATGRPITAAEAEECFKGDFQRDLACLEAKDLHIKVSVQPADRYWSFQWLEFAGYVLLGGLLAGVAYWRINRGLN